MARVVITHPEMGVFLGVALGLGLWTKLDCAGQPAACNFKDETDARQFVSTWIECNNPDDYRYVAAGGPRGATIADLKAAGLGDLLGDMEADAPRYAEPAGHA